MRLQITVDRSTDTHVLHLIDRDGLVRAGYLVIRPSDVSVIRRHCTFENRDPTSTSIIPVYSIDPVPQDVSRMLDSVRMLAIR